MEEYLNAGGRAAESKRWIGIASKLLAAKDLVGSKSFALRAQESDPNSQPASQILAVVDTLFAGEKRINNQQDLYSILQLPHSSDNWEIIAANYRRLALLLNPHMNNFPFADKAFRFVLEAWSILSNSSRKSVYDNKISFQPTFNSIPEQLDTNLDQNQETQFQEETLDQNPSNLDETENVVGETELHNEDDFGGDESLTFWTACPYCYNMYEYPRVYVECCLRCQNCQRAFQAVNVAFPPHVDFDAKEFVFSCFGFFPILISQKHDGGTASNWCPFSQIVACSPPVENFSYVDNGNAETQTNKKSGVGRNAGPVVYVDDDEDDPEVLDEMLDSGDDDSSDNDWRNSSYISKKKPKSMEKPVSSGRRGRPPKKSIIDGGEKPVSSGRPGRPSKQSIVDGGEKPVSSGKRGRPPKQSNVDEGEKPVSSGKRGRPPKQSNVDEGEKPVSSGRRGRPPKQSNVNGVTTRVLRSGLRLNNTEPSEKDAGNNLRRQSGRVAKKNLGKLDLNVELNNEVEDPNGGGRREEENNEGNGFFEGLDEFLSNLPILSEDKVKEVA